MKNKVLLLFLVITTPLYAGEWISDPNSECKTWNPNPAPNETISYIGKCVDGIANGKGALTWFHSGEKVATHIGTFRDGVFVGGGYTWFENGEKEVTYEGDYKDWHFHGDGIYTNENGDIYSGGWVKGKRHGKGKVTFPDGSSYKGLWENGVRIKIFD